MNIRTDGSALAAGIKQLFIGKPKKAAVFIARYLEINPMSGMNYIPELLESVKDEKGEIDTEKLITELDRIKTINIAQANAGKAQINLQEEAQELWNDMERIAEAVNSEMHTCEAIDTDKFMKIIMNFEPGSQEWNKATKIASTEQLKIARGKVYTKWADVYKMENLNPRLGSVLHHKHKELDFQITQRVKSKGKIEDKESIEFNKLTEAMEKAESANENQRRKGSKNPQAAKKKALPTGTSAPPVTSSGRGETPVPPPFDGEYKNRKIQKGEVGELW